MEELEPLTHEDLLKLYELTKEEERFFVEGHNKRLGFYSALATTVLGVTIYQFSNVNRGDMTLMLSLGPLLAISICHLGVRSCQRYYRRSLEVITMIIKLELRLGIDKSSDFDESNTEVEWSDENLIPMTQRESRCEHLNSHEFVRKKEFGGEFSHTKKFFAALIIISILMLFVINSSTNSILSVLLPAIGLVLALKDRIYNKLKEMGLNLPNILDWFFPNNPS